MEILSENISLLSNLCDIDISSIYKLKIDNGSCDYGLRCLLHNLNFNSFKRINVESIIYFI